MILKPHVNTEMLETVESKITTMFLILVMYDPSIKDEEAVVARGEEMMGIELDMGTVGIILKGTQTGTEGVQEVAARAIDGETGEDKDALVLLLSMY